MVSEYHKRADFKFYDLESNLLRTMSTQNFTDRKSIDAKISQIFLEQMSFIPNLKRRWNKNFLILV